MDTNKRILLMGGTGAIGSYLAPALLKRGYHVFVTTRSERVSDNPNLTYLRINAKDDANLDALLTARYDAIVDFMIYRTDAFQKRCLRLLKSTDHYLLLSSYRVYAGSDGAPITEESPRLLEAANDEEYLKTDEYALTKARQEDILRASGESNFTIIRPAITFSHERFQLGTMEAEEFLVRAIRKKPVIFPREMLNKQATMSWAGDVGSMIAALVLNPAAFKETYTAATAEHHTWGEILRFYKKRLHMKAKIVSLAEYEGVVGRPWQIRYDRMLDRVIDNRKILEATGMRQADLKPLFQGLDEELTAFLRDPHFRKVDEAMQQRFDALTERKPPLSKVSQKLRRIREYHKRGVLWKAIKNRLKK